MGLFYDDDSLSEGGRDNWALFLFRRKMKIFSLSVPLSTSIRQLSGSFAGTLRFSEDFSDTHGIRGPVKNFWLDYSQVTGILNQMQVLEADGPASVRLKW